MAEGEVVEVIYDGKKIFYRIRWADGTETVEPEWRIKPAK